MDWDEMQTILTSDSKHKFSDNYQITHFGARLVYVEENAVFVQSVENDNTGNQDLITLEVPPTQKAFLLVAAVSNNGRGEALLFGTMDDLSLSRGTVYDWSAENINWVIPHWTVADSLADEYDNGVLIADKDKENMELILKVTDPFYPFLERVLPYVSYDDNLIKLNGTGGMSEYDYESGIRDFHFQLSNPDVGNANTASYNNIYPRLDGHSFNLSSVRFVVYDTIELSVSWE
ncbi:hypothetical protein BH23BAC3_BH23BAC3_36060 [soil metagenome]